MSNEKVIWDYLKAKGINDFGTAGLMGNLYAESGLRPDNLKNTYNKKFNMTDEQYTNIVNDGSYLGFAMDSAGYGLAQWTSKGRKQGLWDLARRRKCKIDDLNMQLDYLYLELNGSYKNVLTALKRAKSVKEASDIVLTKYEKPRIQDNSVKAKRAQYGQEIYSRNAVPTVTKPTNNSAADKVISIALGEVGYIEKSKVAYLADPTVLDRPKDGAGADNYTKYGRDMHNIYPGVMDFPAAWCDAFVDWCFYKAYGVATAKSLLGGNFNDYTVASSRMYQAKGALDTNPTVGSQVFFTKNGQTSGCHHTGLVYKTDGTYFYTIEGNTSTAEGVIRNGGSVAKKAYRLSDYAGKVLFGHPNYSYMPKQSVTPAQTTPKDTSGVEPAKSLDKSLAGKYVVSSVSNLNIRLGAGKSKPAIGSIRNGTVVHNYGYYTDADDIRWLYIVAGNVKGYCSSNYLEKV